MRYRTLDPFETQWDEHALRAYVERHWRDLASYVRSRYPRDSFEGHMRDLLSAPPVIPRTVIENHRLTEAEKWEDFMGDMGALEGGIVLILGEMGSFKSTFAWDMAKELSERTGRPVNGRGDPRTMPSFARPISSLNEADYNAIVVNDELAITSNSRTTATKEQRVLGAELALTRQNRNIIIGVVQNMNLADKTFLTLVHTFIIKRLGLTQRYTERRGVAGLLDFWEELLPRDRNEETLIITRNRLPRKLWRDRPEWMESGLNSAYRRVETRAEAVEMAVRMRRARKGFNVIASHMGIMGHPADPKTWQEWILAANGGEDPHPEKKTKGRRGREETAEA